MPSLVMEQVKELHLVQLFVSQFHLVLLQLWFDNWNRHNNPSGGVVILLELLTDTVFSDSDLTSSANIGSGTGGEIEVIISPKEVMVIVQSQN